MVYITNKRLKMDVTRREEAKRVASGGGHFRPTERRAGIAGVH